MKCKGSHYAGGIISESVEPAEIKANQPKVCGSEEWELIWVKCLVEEGHPLNMYQCRICKRIVVDTEEIRYSDRWI